MRGRLLPVLLFIALCAVRGGAQVRELTPEESVRLGLERNARVRAVDNDVLAAAAALQQARALRLPSVRLQTDFTQLSSNIPDVSFTLPGSDSIFTFQSVQRRRYQGDISIAQSLFTGSRVREQVRAAAHNVRAAELRAEQERSDVAYEIRVAYWNLYRASEAAAALASATARVEGHLAEMRERVREGAALRRDLLAAQTRLSEVRLERLEADNAIRTSQLELNRLIGFPLDTQIRPTARVAVDTTRADMPALVQAALSRRPQLGMLAAELDALAAEVSVSEAGRWPQLDFIGRYLYARPNPYFFMEQDRFRSTWELGFTTRWDIWEGGRRSAQSSELTARLHAAEVRLADVRDQVAVDVARKQLDVVRAREAIGVAAQNVSEAEETFRVTTVQFREGAALGSDVLDAEEALRRAQARQARVLADYAIARAALLNAAGEVW